MEHADDFLRELRAELVALGLRRPEEALADAREFLGHELWELRRSRPELTDEAALARVVERCGSPVELARAYVDAEDGPSLLARLRRSPAGILFASGWKVTCARCGFAASARLAALSPLRVSWHPLRKRVLGWCPDCRRLRFLRMTPLGHREKSA